MNFFIALSSLVVSLFHSSRDLSAVSRQDIRPETVQVVPQAFHSFAPDQVRTPVSQWLDADQPR
jgi:hypothetical protein